MLRTSAFLEHLAGVEDSRDNVAERMDRLAAAITRSREQHPRHRFDRGEELENLIRLAEEFPVRRRGHLRYPVLKRLGWDKRHDERRTRMSTGK